jgi:hypothetical protein
MVHEAVHAALRDFPVDPFMQVEENKAAQRLRE